MRSVSIGGALPRPDEDGKRDRNQDPDDHQDGHDFDEREAGLGSARHGR